MKKIVFFLHDFLLIIVSIIFKVFDIINPFEKKDKLNKVKNIVIIANGPSLKKDIKKISKPKKILLDVYALNYFALTKYFNLIKPNFYFMADAVFWRNDLNKQFKQDNSKLFKKLLKVNWQITLYCPESGYQTLLNKLKDNKNIIVKSVKPRTLVFKSEKINIFSLINGFSKSLFNNVLIFGLWHAVLRKVNNIKIYGADMSSFKDFIIDQHSNKLYSSPKHFYINTEAQKKGHDKYKKKKIIKKIHNRLQGVSSSFFHIYLLSKVAEKLGIKLFNYSKMSYIDSIKRPKL